VHVLFLTDNYPPERNAPAARVHERACYWVEAGHEVTVVTGVPNFPEGKVFEGYSNRWYQTETIEGIHVVRVRTLIRPNTGFAGRVLDFVSFMISGTVAGLFQPRPDVVVATSPQFFTAIAGFLVGFLRSVPFVFELADLWPATIRAVGAMRSERLLRAVEIVELFLYRRSAAVVALTRTFKVDLVQRRIPAGKVAVVTNGVDLRVFEPRARDNGVREEFGLIDRFVVGYLGTHGLSQDLGNLLMAAELNRDEDRLRYLMVGAGAERKALLRERDRRCLQNVRMVTSQPKERMPLLWSACDVALVHLKNDPVFATVLPSKIFEAMGMGLPIVLVSPAGEASELVQDEGVGLWVPAGDPRALADVTLELSLNPDLTTRLSCRSRKVASKFSRERQAKRMMDVLEAVRSGRGCDLPAHLV
jgi:putative colanic acid biosynthesis glycosyltransferase WcaI